MSTSSPRPLSPWIVAAELRKLDLEPELEVDRGGQRFDVVAPMSDGTFLGILLKAWDLPDGSALAKARREVELLRAAGTVDHPLVVLPSLAEKQQTTELCDLEGLRPAVERLLAPTPDFGFRGRRASRRDGSPAPRLRRIFVAMPFAAHFEDTYYLGILPAAQAASASCVRIDEQYLTAPILESVHREIKVADLIVADLTEGNPNVTYELGFAHALKKPSIHISATEPEKLPFDVRQWPTVLYAAGQIHRLRDRLGPILIELLSTAAAAAQRRG